MNKPNLFRGFPSRLELEESIERMSLSEWLLTCMLVLIMGISMLSILGSLNNHFLVAIPEKGGTFTEGIVGTPSLVNPVLASSQADKDATALIFSGLMRKTGSGELVPDLAESFTASEDGKTYTFTLRDELTFHDGKPLTSADVLYTIRQVENPLVKSPRRLAWDQIQVEAPDAKTVVITLPESNSGFLEKTTLGILPMHLWQDVSPDQFASSVQNTEAVGSGPYKITKTKRHSSGLVYEYHLKAFKKSFEMPLVESVNILFYDNAESANHDLANHNIDAEGGIDPESVKTLDDKSEVVTLSLPRVFGLFFNQNQATFFADKDVRTAIAMSIDTERIAKVVLGGYAVPLHGVLPGADEGITFDPAKAIEMLDKAGWKKQEDGTRTKMVGKEEKTLEFTIATGDAPELSSAAEVILENLRDVGVKVFIKPYELGLLNQTIIRPRKYDSLLFGQVVNQPSDLYAFWHSSERTDPGLNVALYTSVKADKALESAIHEQDTDKRAEFLASAINTISTDVPAVFLYSPEYVYALPTKLQGFTGSQVAQPQDRFADIRSWYVRTNKIWKVFVK